MKKDKIHNSLNILEIIGLPETAIFFKSSMILWWWQIHRTKHNPFEVKE